MSYYGDPPPPPPGAGAIAAQIMTSILQQSAVMQQAAQWALNEAQIAHVMRAHRTEKKQMVIPEAVRPVHHNTLQSMLKKTRAIEPITPPPHTAIEQGAMVDLSSAEGAARAHTRGPVGMRPR